MPRFLFSGGGSLPLSSGGLQGGFSWHVLARGDWGTDAPAERKCTSQARRELHHESTGLMSNVIRVALQNREGAVDLLKQDHPGKFVGQRHLAKGEDCGGGLASFVREAVGWSYGQD